MQKNNFETNDSRNIQKIQLIHHWYAAIRQAVGYKTLLALFAILVAMFTDVAIPMINNVIQLKVDLLGLLLEPLLQSIFDIPLRQAQVLAAWIYLILGIFLVWYVFKKIYLILFKHFYALREKWLAKNRLQKTIISVFVLLLFVAAAKMAFLFI